MPRKFQNGDKVVTKDQEEKVSTYCERYESALRRFGQDNAYMVITGYDIYNYRYEYEIHGDNGPVDRCNCFRSEHLDYYTAKVTNDPNMINTVVIEDHKREEIMAALDQIASNDLIFKEWGFDEIFEKGTAISLLFYGPPGTGKTLMGEAIAAFLGRELKVIQTAEIQTSVPGQAERNLKQYFEAADKNNHVLLFDECDSLIYDRAEVGMILAAEINSLLSALERYKGVAIFTTNRLGKMDPAFERRVSAKIEFPFPKADLRAGIWKRMIPDKAPVAKDVDFSKLAELPLAGGNIKNVVLNAARLAAYRKQKTITSTCFLDAAEKEIQGIKEMKESNKKNSNPWRSRLAGATAEVGRDVQREEAKANGNARWTELLSS